MIKSIAAQNAACNTIVRMVDNGTLFPTGCVDIYNADSTFITSLSFSYPAFRDATDGTAVSNMIMDATAVRDGTMALFSIMSRDRTSVWSGTISNQIGSGDMRLNTVSIYRDSTVSLASAYYAVPR
jgi:hypothetical protein